MRGEISFEKAAKIAELSMELQPAATRKVVGEQLSSKETALLVQTILNEPDRKEEILVTSINELTPAPPEVLEFVKEYGAEERMFMAGNCPRCDLEYKIDWTLHTIWWEEDSDE